MRTSLITLLLSAAAAAAAPNIVCPPDAPANVRLAAKEIRRYVYLRTGELLQLADAGSGIALKVDPALAAEQYRLKTDGEALTISGGSDIAVLYGAYAFAEKLGVRFQIDGDVIPGEPVAFALPKLDEVHQPLFERRGLQPFHDFPEGPDWWTQDDWLAVADQCAKMRMNFIGLHTYPFHNRDLGPEPTVWIGLPEDVNPDGTVKVSDFASWYTTAKFMPYGCYRPMKTGGYSFGASLAFPSDDYGPAVNGPDDYPMPKTPEASVALVNRTGAMLKRVFDHARALGMHIAVGTESPLDIPDAVAARLKERGLDARNPATLERLYAGMFTRIQRAYPIDTYWIWGHEGEIDQGRFVTNLTAARAALKSLGDPFGLGVCGWGWITGNFPALDRNLPKDIAFSAINMSAGRATVSENFDRLADRAKWAIPWIEDDSVLSSIQLRAGRLRRDAVDARRYGCNGLMGIHWRTRILGPNIAALAQAGWEQGAWSSPTPATAKPRDVTVLGGQTAAFLNHAVAGTELDPIYQTVRFNLRGYRFTVPDGRYDITLRFSEPAYAEPGKRVFGVKVQGEPVAEHLDVFARVGQYAALDVVRTNVAVTGGVLRIDFAPEVEYPCIAAIDVVGAGVVRRVNCGGPEYQDYAADAEPESLPRDLPVDDFYRDWALAQFGPDAGPAAAAIFTKLDGNFPATSAWIQGPGVMAVSRQPWAEAAARFAFVDDFAALRPRVRNAAERERFEWWLNTFRVTREMGHVGSLRGELDAAMASIAKEPDGTTRQRRARTEALPIRISLLQAQAALHEALLGTLNNATELGTICNIEQQSMLRTRILNAHDGALETYLGAPLPKEAQAWQDYRGPPRLVVLTARGAAARGEALVLPIVALEKEPVRSVMVHVRPLGTGTWQTVQATGVARAVWRAMLPAAREDFEYNVTAETAGAGDLKWPATAPARNHTVIVL